MSYLSDAIHDERTNVFASADCSKMVLCKVPVSLLGLGI